MSTETSPAPANSAPSTAGTGTGTPRTGTEKGIVYARDRVGSRKRSTITEVFTNDHHFAAAGFKVLF